MGAVLYNAACMLDVWCQCVSDHIVVQWFHAVRSYCTGCWLLY